VLTHVVHLRHPYRISLVKRQRSWTVGYRYLGVVAVIAGAKIDHRRTAALHGPPPVIGKITAWTILVSRGASKAWRAWPLYRMKFRRLERRAGIQYAFVGREPAGAAARPDQASPKPDYEPPSPRVTATHNFPFFKNKRRPR